MQRPTFFQGLKRFIMFRIFRTMALDEQQYMMRKLIRRLKTK